MATMFRAIDFGQNFESYYAGEKDDVLGVIQIETLGLLITWMKLQILMEWMSFLWVPWTCHWHWGSSDNSIIQRISNTKKINEAARKAGKATGV